MAKNEAKCSVCGRPRRRPGTCSSCPTRTPHRTGIVGKPTAAMNTLLALANLGSSVPYPGRRR